ncbi:MAG: SMP-30/gluconolactonase/LRE family protein [Candidatus Magnetomorum sp.]|nr:SMP-30/gluconolactonase/LRE family protein [Candidatus Magnetomorum sp.]
MTYYLKGWIILKMILIFGLMNSTFTACHQIKNFPEYDEATKMCERIYVADGPEDFVLDQWNNPPRLLISSHERRKPETFGGIYSLSLTTHATQKLQRTGENNRFKAYKPHGMDIRHVGQQTYLYVILHDPYHHNQRIENAIAVYEVFENDLLLIDVLENSTCLWSPNDVSVLPDGQIYVTNDYRSSFDLLFKRAVSEIVHYQPKTKAWQVVAKNMCYANGILAQSDHVFVSTTLGNELLKFKRQLDGRLENKQTIARIKGLDNIMPYQGRLLITAHLSNWAFLKHYKSKDSISPTAVYLVNPNLTNDPSTSTLIYRNDGTDISAASTAIIHNQFLYIAQVFDPFLLKYSYMPIGINGK